MFPQSTTKNVFISLVVINLILVGAYVVLYLMLDGAVSETQKLSKKIDQRLNEGRRRADLQRMVSETASARNNLDSFFVPADGTAGFITTIESLAGDAQVKLDITDVSVSGTGSSEESPKNLFEELTLKMKANGNWQEVIHFIRLIESLPKDSTIQGVELERVASAEELTNQEWSAVMTLTVRKLP